ncbi:MAG: tetratricopeptide repeat protein [Bradymonadia bacterium]
MKITCPKCGADQSFMDGLEPTPGALIACTQCSHVFAVPERAQQDESDPLGVFGDDPFLSLTPPPTSLYIRTNEGRVIGPYETSRVQSLINKSQLTGQEDASVDQRVWMPLKSFPGIEAQPALQPAADLTPTPLPSSFDPMGSAPGDAYAHLGGQVSAGDGGQERMKPEDFEFRFHVEDLGLDIDPLALSSAAPDGVSESELPAGVPLPEGDAETLPLPSNVIMATPNPEVGQAVPHTPPPPDLPAPVGESPRSSSMPSALRGVDPMADLPAPKGPVPDDVPDWGIDLPAPKALSDLPAPKAVSDLPAPKSVSDLPGFKGATDLPAPRAVVDLPGPRAQGGMDLPGPTDLPSVSDTPSPMSVPGVGDAPSVRGADPMGGEVGAADLPAPKVEAELPAPKVAIGRMVPRKTIDISGDPAEQARRIDEIFEGVEPPPSGPGMEDPVEEEEISERTPEKVTPPAPKQASKRSWMLLGVLGVAGAAAIGASAALGLGPFADQPKPIQQPKDPSVLGNSTTNPNKKPTKDPQVDPKPVGEQAPIAEVVRTEGFVQISDYRKAVAELEQRGEPKGDLSTLVTELYAFGALEFPGGDRWGNKAQQMVSRMPEAVRSDWKGERAAYAAALANLGDKRPPDGMVNDIIEFAGRHPEDARSQHLLGLLRVRLGMDKQAAKAFADATRSDTHLLPAWRMLALSSAASGEIEQGRAALKHLTEVKPAAPINLEMRARLGFAQSQLEDAKTASDELLALDTSTMTARERAAAFTLSGRIALKQNDKKAAIEAFRQSVETWPSDLEAVEMLSEVLFEEAAYDQALSLFEKLRGAGVNTPELVVAIAESHQALKGMDKALAVLQEGIKAFPESSAIRRALGKLEVRMRRYDRARVAYDKALEVAPDDHQTHLDIVAMLMQQSQVADAIKYLEEVLKVHPDSALLQFGYGRLMHKVASADTNQELLAMAERSLRKAVELDPSLDEARHKLVEAYLDRGEAEAAQAQLKILIARGTYSAPLDFDQGRVAMATGQPDQAIKYFETALARQPKNGLFMLALGTAQFHKRDYDAADQTLREVARLNGNLTDAHYYMGRVAFDRGRFPAAVRKFKLAHDDKKGNLVYHYWLGRALEATGKITQASAAYNTVAESLSRQPEINRKLYDAFYRRGQMRMMRSLYSRASEDFKKVLDYDATRAEVWIAYGDSFSLRGRSDLALKHYQQAITLSPENGDAHLKAAQSLLRQDKVNEAVPFLRNAVKFNDTLAEPHYSLCVIYRDKRKNALAAQECEAYLKVAPNGDYAEEARRELKRLKKGG